MESQRIKRKIARRFENKRIKGTRFPIQSRFVEYSGYDPNKPYARFK